MKNQCNMFLIVFSTFVLLLSTVILCDVTRNIFTRIIEAKHQCMDVKPHLQAIKTVDSRLMSTAIQSDENVLQKHVAFFDRNHDGVIYPWETFKGFRAIGSGILLSSVASVFINVGLSRKTRPGKMCPNLLFPIEIQNIHMAKHGSDSGVYDAHGRFVPSKFEEIFHKYARSHPDALTEDELNEFIKGNREPKDYGGWIGGLSEWKILYYLAKDKNELLKKDIIRAVYDGTLFVKMAEEKKTKSSMKKKKT